MEVTKIPNSLKLHHKIQNNSNQLVGFVGSSDSECFGFIGIGRVVNDMHTLSLLPGRQIVAMVKTMYSIVSLFETSDEL